MLQRKWKGDFAYLIQTWLKLSAVGYFLGNSRLAANLPNLAEQWNLCPSLPPSLCTSVSVAGNFSYLIGRKNGPADDERERMADKVPCSKARE